MTQLIMTTECPISNAHFLPSQPETVQSSHCDGAQLRVQTVRSQSLYSAPTSRGQEKSLPMTNPKVEDKVQWYQLRLEEEDL